jgi:hypothetical protein
MLNNSAVRISNVNNHSKLNNLSSLGMVVNFELSWIVLYIKRVMNKKINDKTLQLSRKK